jgi:hypothetical protein
VQGYEEVRWTRSSGTAHSVRPMIRSLSLEKLFEQSSLSPFCLQALSYAAHFDSRFSETVLRLLPTHRTMATAPARRRVVHEAKTKGGDEDEGGKAVGVGGFGRAKEGRREVLK